MLRFLLQRKIIVGLSIVFIFIAGIYGINRLDKELFPNVEFNQTIVQLETDEMPAEDVEQFVTIPVEKALEQIDGVTGYDSSSMIGTSTIMVELKETDSEDTTKEIESSVAELKDDLHGVKDSIVFQASTNNEFEMFLDISNASDEEMEKLALDTLQPRLEALPEVGKVDVSGLKHPQIEIKPKEKKLTEYNLQTEDIISTIQQANQSSTLGILDKEDNTPAIRMPASLQQANDIRKIKINTPEDTITVADVADISTKDEDEIANAWKNGETDFLIVQIGRANNVGQIAMTDAVRDELKKIDKEVNPSATIHEIAAQGDYVDQAIDGIVENIIIGGIIAIVVLLLFLRNIRATIIIGLSIPASILLTILSMTLLNYSFNLLTLIGLGLGIGMLVDASIVVLESIFQKKELGYNKLDAVLIGTKEVAGAVIASMLTTIVVFVPVVLLDNDVGKMIFALTVVIAITLISSVLIAFTLIPVLSENFLCIKKKKEPRFHIIDKYGAILRWLTHKKRRRLSVLAIFLIVFVGSFFLIAKIPTNFMPDILNRYAEVAIELEPGTTPQERDKLAKEISTELESIPDVESNVILDNKELIAVLINMTPEEEKTLEQTEINDQIFDRLGKLEEETAISSISSMMEGVAEDQVEIHIKGENMDQLENISQDMVTELEQLDEIGSANMELSSMQNELLIDINEDKAEDDGLTSAQIQHTVANLFQEENIGDMTIDNKELPLIVKHASTIEDKNELLKQKIPTENGENPLSDYITLKEADSFTQIDREDGERYISVTADVSNGDLKSLHQHINQLLNDFDMDDGYSATIAGDLDEQQQAATELIMIFVISIFLVFVVMAIQLNSLKFPFIILAIIPLTVTGVIIGLFITQKELNVLSAIGIIMLIGIVINNGILLIDRARQLRAQDYNHFDAIVLAGKERIRPIFMTTLTTVGGMLPLALATGASSDYQSPLAVAIMSGLIFSTLITLILIPSLYLLLEDINRGINKLFKRKQFSKKTEHTRLSS